jgi:hypothetical protein
VLKELRLVPFGGSTRLNGQLINKTNRQWDTITFALKAYDGAGRQLRGTEKETIFSFTRFGRGTSAPINSGYGVRLEGIPFDAIARLELSLLGDKPNTAHPDAREKFTDLEE